MLEDRRVRRGRARHAVACLSALAGVAALGLLTPRAALAVSFVEFESGPVRPLAITPDGTRLLATNTPDNQLELFSITPSGIVHTGNVPVGMEPVAVAAR